MISEADSKILTLARERFDAAETAERPIREAARNDLRNLAGEQWDPEELTWRKKSDRPALVINKLPQFVDQVVNEQRKDRPGPKVSPVGGGADADTADICRGMIRHIEQASHAEIAQDTAFEYSASCGFGFWRYRTEYADSESFDQEILVEAIEDPFAVYIDNNATKVDRSDMRWAFIIETLTKEEFKRRYPKSETTESDFFFGSDPASSWVREDGVRIAEYWTIESKKRTLQLLSDGSKRYKDDETQVAAGLTVVKERVCEEPVVKQYIINGAEILDRSEWPGKFIPIVPVYGKQLIVDGERKLFSLIRFAIDPQQLYNYAKSGMAENIGLASKAAYIGYVGQFKTKSADWRDSNRIPFAYLEADPVKDGNGNVLPLPQRNQFEPAVVALANAALGASDDIKATTGLFDPSLGNGKASMSGRALESQKAEGDNSNFHLVDNLRRSILHGYRILLDLIPKVYDAPRVVRIVKPDHESEEVLINQMFVQGADGRPEPYDQQLHQGVKPKIHDLGLGRYDVVVSVGASYETRREETRDHLADLAKADPGSLAQWADLYIKQLDLGPIGDEIAERLTPAQYRDKGNPQAAQAQLAQQGHALQQLSAQHEALVNQLHELAQELESKRYEQETKIEIARLQEETKRAIAENADATRLAIAEMSTKAQSEARASADALAVMEIQDSMEDRAHRAALETTGHAVAAATQLAGHEHAAGLAAAAAPPVAEEPAEPEPLPIAA